MGSDSAETARLVKAVGEDVVSFATQGGLLTKFPFGEGAAPKVRFFQASDDGMYLLWGDAKQAGNLPSRLALAEVEAIVQGTRTHTFKRHAARVKHPQLCLSLVTEARSLDLQAETETDYRAWHRAMQHLVRHARQGIAAAELSATDPPPPPPSTAPAPESTSPISPSPMDASLPTRHCCALRRNSTVHPTPSPSLASSRSPSSRTS